MKQPAHALGLLVCQGMAQWALKQKKNMNDLGNVKKEEGMHKRGKVVVEVNMEGRYIQEDKQPQKKKKWKERSRDNVEEKVKDGH